MKKLFRIFMFLCFATTMQAQLITPADGVLIPAESGDTLGKVSFVNLKTWIAAATESGTVTSVGLSLPSEFSVTGSPVTESGTLAGSWVEQTQNKVFASPNGSNGTPIFRALVSNDIPTLAASKVTGSNVTAGSTKITLGGTPTGAGLSAFSIDVNESNLDLANLGGSLNLATQITGTLPIASGGTGVTSLDDIVAGSSKISITGGGATIVGGNATLDINEGNLDLDNIGGTLGIDQLQSGTANQITGTNAAGTANEFKTLSVGTSGTDFAITHAANSVTFNLPSASASNRGVVTNSAQTLAGTKTLSGGAIVQSTGSTAAIELEGTLKEDVSTITTATTLTNDDSYIEADVSGGAYTITLPATAGFKYTIVKSDSSTNALTVDLNGANTFMDGSQSKILTGQGTSITVVIGSTSSNSTYRH